jgi:methylthioribose-1-phosphate isomerase
VKTIQPVPTIVFEDGIVSLLDQTLLPLERRMIEVGDAETMWEAIKVLRVRGAPAIGVAAGFGLWLGVKSVPDDAPRDAFFEQLEQTRAYLATSRPTAVNLFWALDRIVSRTKSSSGTVAIELKKAVLHEALEIKAAEEATSLAIGEYGVPLLNGVSSVLTHCNAGSLATTGIGTALAPIYAAAARGQIVHVYADETRPLLQGARLTAWELQQAGLPVTVITDNMAATVMRDKGIGAVIVGCDRVAANGDFANKIGTYGVAILAREHSIPFYVAAPFSTIDFETPNGSRIEIEQRDPLEVTHFGSRQTAPDGVDVFNPAFDMTPAKYVTAFITDRGVIEAPYLENLKRAAMSNER